MSVRNHRLDRATIKAMSLALPSATTLLQLRLYNAGLDSNGLDSLASALVGSSVSVVHIEYNPLANPKAVPDAEEKQIEGGGASNADSAEGKVEVVDEEKKSSDAADSGEGGGENPAPAPAEPEDPSCKFARLLDLPLMTLWLRGNDISAAGAKAIAKKLYGHKSLNSLNLFDNKLGEVGGQAMIDMLYCNRSITQLILGRNGIPSNVADKVLLPVCDPTVPTHVGQERESLGLAYGGETAKKAEKEEEEAEGWNGHRSASDDVECWGVHV